MSENQLVMVSEWMSNGNILQFTKADADADRLGLVGFSPAFIPFIAYGRLIDVAQRRRKRVDLYARPENSSWEPQRGMFSNPVLAVLPVVYPPADKYPYR